MKKSYFLLLSLLVLSVLSCDNEFNVNDDWQDVTVVYSLLDPAADTNWVRVQRGYLGEAPPSVSYDRPDSLYYDSLVVYLKAFDGQGQLKDSIYLYKDVSKKLEPGIYTTAGYRLYRDTTSLNEDYTYQLNVKKTNAKFTDAKATTELVGPFKLRIPVPAQSFPTFNGTIEWFPSKGAKIYQVDLTFRYKEYDISSKTSSIKAIKFDYGTLDGAQASGGGGTLDLSKPITDLYSLLASKIIPDENKLRFFESIRIDIQAGGENLRNYMILNQPTNTINQGKPEFPGIENGTGLFSSRTSTSLDNIEFNNEIASTYYLKNVLCGLRFATVERGDTFYCNNIPGLGPQKTKFN